MKTLKVFLSFVFVVLSLSFGACSSSSTNSSSPNPDAIAYANFGKTLNDAIPAGLKTGGASANIAASLIKELSEKCAENYTDCPNFVASGGADSSAGEILMRIWGLDYNDECTDTFLENGTCFNCADCQTGSVGTTNFIRPTMLAAPTECASTSTSAGRYVNFGVDPCFFDSMIGQISNIAECETVKGVPVEILKVVPWYELWGIPKDIAFSSYYARSGGGGMWWTVNDGPSENKQSFLSLDSNWLYAGIKDVVNDKFLFLGTGSPAYYAGRGEGLGVNIAGYAGTLSAIPASFEAIQVRVQDPNNYIERMKSNGHHLWYQAWSGVGYFPSLPADVATVKDDPSDNRCVEIGDSVAESKYVPLGDCVTSFGFEKIADLNSDDNFTLKIIDGQTANSIDFSTKLTPTTETSCLEEEEEETPVQ